MCDWKRVKDEGRDNAACHHRKEAIARPKDSQEPIYNAGEPRNKAELD